MNQSEQITNVLKGLFQVQNEMNNVKKDSKNPFYKSNYADINALNEELKPLLKDAGLVVLQPPSHIDGSNFIQTTVYHHESGEFISSLNEVIASKQNDPQSFLAAQTYTRRGALQAFFNMGSVDDDGNTASNRKVTEDKPSGFSRKSVDKKTETVVDSKQVEESPKEVEEQPKTESTPRTRSFRRNRG